MIREDIDIRGGVGAEKLPHFPPPRSYSPPHSVNLEGYKAVGYHPGNLAKRVSWIVVSRAFFESNFPWPSGLKSLLLRLYGARVGKGVVIKPQVKIKYPWFLAIGDHSWIGEHCWIDNLAKVSLGAHVVLSQSSFLLTGNHDYHSPSFDLRVAPVCIEDGAWIAARAIVCPGVTVKSHAVLSVGTVAKSDLKAFGVYSGNPATYRRERQIRHRQ